MNLGTIIQRCRTLNASFSTSRWNQQTLANLANDAQVQLSLEVDFPEATRYFASNPAPAAGPTLAVVGAAGPVTAKYAYVNIAVDETGANVGGDSYPSPTTAIADAPETLTAENYVTVTMATVPGRAYRVLRQLSTDPFPLLLTTFVATGATAVYSDNGSASPTFYALQRGNEFQLRELVKILRVYMYDQVGNQQPLVPTDINSLEGVTIEEWDQSSGQVAGAPQYTPRALAQGGVAFPVASPFGRVPVKSPWNFTAGGAQRPMFYMRGGFLGLLPPPLGVYQIRVDYVPKPLTLSQPADLSLFPDEFLDAICYKMLADMAMGDDNSRDEGMLAKFYAEAAKARRTVRGTVANAANTITPIPNRTQMRSWSL